MNFKSLVDPEELGKLNADIKTRTYVDREHILRFLQLIPTSDGPHIVKEVETWLTSLHDDPSYDKVVFPRDDIKAVVSDLDSYGHVSTNTVLKFKEEFGKTVPLG